MGYSYIYIEREIETDTETEIETETERETETGRGKGRGKGNGGVRGKTKCVISHPFWLRGGSFPRPQWRQRCSSVSAAVAAMDTASAASPVGSKDMGPVRAAMAYRVE